MDFSLRPELMRFVRWSRRGSCGEPGCKDPECCCSLCNQPIGVSDDDPRWDEHDEWCDDCDLCRDRVPLMLFRGEGKQCEQASFHGACFEKLLLANKPKDTTHPSGAELIAGRRD
jgi:hypothetical protein